MVTPPRPGDASYEIYSGERDAILASMKIDAITTNYDDLFEQGAVLDRHGLKWIGGGRHQLLGRGGRDGRPRRAQDELTGLRLDDFNRAADQKLFERLANREPTRQRGRGHAADQGAVEDDVGVALRAE